MSERALGGRLPLLAPADLAPAQSRLYEEIVAPPRGTGPFLVVDSRGLLAGPFNALIYSPIIGQAVQALGSALRFGGALPDRTRELLVCLVAAEARCPYEWYAHSRVAATVGVTTAELNALSAGAVPDTVSAAEASVLRLVLALVREGAVGPAIYADALAHHGRSGLVEATTLVGYYQLLASLLIVFDVPAPAGSKEALS